MGLSTFRRFRRVGYSVFRAVITIRTAQEMTAAGITGVVPCYYEPLSRWGFALFYGYAVVGFLALAAYGASMLQVGLLPVWVGWTTLVFNVAMLGILIMLCG